MKVPIQINVMGQEFTAEVPIDTVLDGLPEVTDEQATEEDRHYYPTGENYLTYDQGARKVTKKIMEDMFHKAGQDDSVDSYFTVYNATLAAMTQGVDRGFFYRLAGGILKGFRDEGEYRGIPLAVVYAYKLHKELA